MGRRVLVKQTNFAAGELSPLLHASRTDINQYYNGCKTMLNWYPLLQGGAKRAPGTIHVSQIDGTARLIPFEPEPGVNYLIVLQDQAIKIFKNDLLHQSLTAPWPSSVLYEIDYTQALDTVIFVHQDYAPRRLYRDALDNFILEDLTDTSNASGVYLENIPTEPTVKRWFPSVYYFEGDYVQPTAGNENGYYYVATNSGKSGTAEPTWPTTIGSTVSDGDVTWKCVGLIDDIRLWSSSKGYPRTCVFFQDRLVFGGSRDYPHRIWFSKSGDYYNFDLGIALATDAIDREILADELPIIEWLYAGRNLVIGTSNAEFAVTQTTPVTPSEVMIARQSGIGSAKVKPVSIDGAVIHVTANKKQVRELVYSDVEQSYVTSSLSLLAPHIINDVKEITAAASTSFDLGNLLYVVNGDGTLSILNVLRSQNFAAWCRRTLDGQVESIAESGGKVYAVISFSYGQGVYESNVYDGVYEETGGSSLRLLVYFDDNALLDAQTRLTSATAKTSWTDSKLALYGGVEVEVIADGFYCGSQTVTNSTITTPFGAFQVTVGLAIPTPTLETLPINFDGVQGSVSHMKKRLTRILLQMYETQSLYVNDDLVYIREAQQNINEPIVPFTGIREIRMLGWDRDAIVKITAPEPYKATVLSLTREVVY